MERLYSLKINSNNVNIQKDEQINYTNDNSITSSNTTLINKENGTNILSDHNFDNKSNLDIEITDENYQKQIYEEDINNNYENCYSHDIIINKLSSNFEEITMSTVNDSSS
ncbi:hypothetical protein LY90DRAFT_507454 [Neocallimastix californiae]|uniref:Uncharacterized protein n=1 Tax=Neocallimastix californiae TaxID=1754190 RepID=A0A1Y2D5T8_9FUNG|nr:hypothetical protein LY90DRAFT_507454 [Neocallimastix californiae]|eukprot:ORY54643.1 hypothetical protein LY90DRAFT_507454 [Neocallimastix californiae]